VFLSTVGRILHRTPDNGQDHPHIRHESLATTAIYVDVPLTQRTNAVYLLPDVVFPER
jgi:hypothetical protein